MTRPAPGAGTGRARVAVLAAGRVDADGAAGAAVADGALLRAHDPEPVAGAPGPATLA